MADEDMKEFTLYEIPDDGVVIIEVDKENHGTLNVPYDCGQGHVVVDIHRVIRWIKKTKPEWLA